MKKQPKMSKYKILLLALLGVWIILAVGRTGNNLSKVLFEEKSWLRLSEQQKKEKLFGNLYIFLMRIRQDVPKGKTVTILTDDNRVTYFNKYTLYPLKTVVIETKHDNKAIPEISSDYAAVFSKNDLTRKKIVKHLSRLKYKRIDALSIVPESEMYIK